ncbi:MAG: hypothetical protein IMF12_06180 [Proteobacteria bacterium]|nr:hypothetical protein [Pseudomonadota bacterium]
MKKIFLPILSVVMTMALLSSCATSRKVPVVKAGDNNLSCNQLQTELGRLDQAEQDVESKKGLTGTNVASALFWIPGLAYTYYDAGQATEAINDRRTHLTQLSNDKNCQ